MRFTGGCKEMDRTDAYREEKRKKATQAAGDTAED
jgi:hypothetical protein